MTHPVHGLNVDIIAIPWEQPASDELVKPINTVAFDDDLPIQVGMDVFILGYPHGYSSDPHIAPIWKRGSLATEFAFDIGGMPKVYIDAATAKGMSGSPVIAKLTGMCSPEGMEDQFHNYILNGGRSFLGIYTGRYTDHATANMESDIFNAQLGIVWKKRVIEQILDQ